MDLNYLVLRIYTFRHRLRRGEAMISLQDFDISFYTNGAVHIRGPNAQLSIHRGEADTDHVVTRTMCAELLRLLEAALVLDELAEI